MWGNPARIKGEGSLVCSNTLGQAKMEKKTSQEELRQPVRFGTATSDAEEAMALSACED